MRFEEFYPAHFLGLLLYLTHTKGSASFTTVTTSAGTYSLSSDTMDFNTAQTTCSSIGMAVVSFSGNNEFKRLTDFLNDNLGTYNGKEFWVSITEDSSTASTKYKFGNQEIDNDKWFPFEPTGTCVPNCCYRIRNFIVPSLVNEPFALADTSSCSSNYYVFCGVGDVVTATTSTTEASTSTTEATTSTTEATTISTTEATTTTTETTTSTTETTTTVATTTKEPATTITETATSSTDATTGTTEGTTSTTELTTTSTTEASTTSTTCATTSTTEVSTSTTELTATTTEFTTSAAGLITVLPNTSIFKTDPPLPLSTGQQMTVIYLGLIVGTSLGISCACSLIWLAINRYRRKRSDHDPNKQEKDDENKVDDDSSSDDD